MLFRPLDAPIMSFESFEGVSKEKVYLPILQELEASLSENSYELDDRSRIHIQLRLKLKEKL